MNYVSILSKFFESGFTKANNTTKVSGFTVTMLVWPALLYVWYNGMMACANNVVTTLLLCFAADMEFPQDLFQIIKKIYRYYFHILAHLYHNHFHEYLNLGVHDCLNTLFLHFVYFVQEFQLLDGRELSPLEDFIQKLISVDKDLQKHPPKEDEDVEPMICSKLKN